MNIHHLIHEWILNFAKCFFCIYWGDHVTFIIFVNVVYHIYWLVNVEPSLHYWNKSLDHGVWSFLYIYCWIQFDNILLKILAYIFIRDICLNNFLSFFFFFFCILLVLYQSNGGVIKWFWDYSLLFSFFEYFEKGRD